MKPKLAPLLILTLTLTSALCQDYHKQFTQLLQGLFDLYKADLGTIPDCYADPMSPWPYVSLQWFLTLPQYQITLMNGNRSNYISAFTSYLGSTNFAYQMMQCASKKPAFSAFLKAAGLPSSYGNTSVLKGPFFFYEDAYPALLYSIVQPVNAQMNASNFYKAGQLLYPFINLLKNMSDPTVILRNKGLAIYNGMFLAHKLPFPAQVAACFSTSDSSVGNIAKFYEGWVSLSANMTTSNALSLTQNYFNGAGKSLIDAINSKTMSCILSSTDNKAFQTSSNMTLVPLDSNFQLYIQNYIKTGPGAGEYISLLSGINSNFGMSYYHLGGLRTQVINCYFQEC